MVLTVGGGLYLPPIVDSNKNYIQHLMTGRKKFLYWKNGKAVKIPNIKGLGIKEILEFGREHWQIDQYLPIYKYYKFPRRYWIWSVINSLAN